MKIHKFIIIFIFVLVVFISKANADTLNQNQQFFISSQYDIRARTSINASVRHLSDHAYFYIADDYWIGITEADRSKVLAQVKVLADEFDKRIYPVEIEFFGSEPNPGIDNDPRLTILLTPLIENAGGYFDVSNQHVSADVVRSNQREMIYLNISELFNQSKMFPFLAHEFQHLISYNQKEKLRNVSDDIWLNELRSEYAVTLLGYNDIYEGSHLQRRATALLSDPEDSLTDWKNLANDYGQIGLFGEYIAEHLSPRVIADTLNNKSSGFNSLAESLLKNGYPEHFVSIYSNWLAANFINDASSDKKYSYLKKDLTDLRVRSSNSIVNLGDGASFVISNSIKDWQGKWYDIYQLQSGSKNVMKINFDSPSLTSFLISYFIFGNDGNYQAYEFTPSPTNKELYISSIGTDVSRIVIIPVKKDKIAGFSYNETPINLTISFARVSLAPVMATTIQPVKTQVLPVPVSSSNTRLNLRDGSLIRARGDNKVYVIKGNWRRHIINSKIFSFYSGLGFERVIEVDPDILNSYKESDFVRYAKEKKVYSVDKSGYRRWLNISGQQFSDSGRAWDSIFEINYPEYIFYKIGSDLKL